MNVYTQHGFISTEPYFSVDEIERRIADITQDEIEKVLKCPRNFKRFSWWLCVYRSVDQNNLRFRSYT